MANLPDEEIDYSDIPPLTDEEAKQLVRGNRYLAAHYRPINKPATLPLDSDVIDWLKGPGQGWQTRANANLREAMLKST